MQAPAGRLGEVAALFLRLGTLGFGGPAAHIALMEREVVERRRWLTPETFLDLVSAASLIPGPNSTELAIHIGYRRGGWAGLLVAGVCFIVPAMLIVALFAWAYVTYGSLPAAGALLRGVLPVVIVIVLHALWRLARVAITSGALAATAGVAAALSIGGAHELLVLLGAGVFGWVASKVGDSSVSGPAGGALAILPQVAGAGGVAAFATSR